MDTSPSRRLSYRRSLERPVEASLLVCGGDGVSGWILDEQDDGLGMAFGGEDVARLQAHASCCVGQAVDLWLADDETRGRPVPVRLVHVTEGEKPGTCRAGLAFEVRRMAPQDIVHLMTIWRRLLHPRREGRPTPSF